MAVDDILLDTGSARTLVKRDLVPDLKVGDGEIAIRCAHGDIATYPLASVEIAVGGKEFVVEAAVSETLPVSVLLGGDVPELVKMVKDGCSPDTQGKGMEEVMVTTRAQKRVQEREAKAREESERESGAQPNPIWQLGRESEVINRQDQEVPSTGVDTPVGEGGESECGASVQEDEEVPGVEFDVNLFAGGREKVKLSRKENRINKHRFRQEGSTQHPLDLTAEELRQLQEEDRSLEAVRKAVRGEASSAGAGFFRRDGLIYRKWSSPGQGMDDREVEQLVLPVQCRQAVLQLAHEVPIAGHMGKNSTARRILQRFYWPSVYKDTAEFCRCCGECQKSAPGRKQRAPLIPLPVIDVPFRRIAMDIVGPLPRSRAGSKYILVICDYATRYPEAIPLRSIDAVSVAEELVKVMARVGVPEEILTDQGSNFTSQLLAEVYRLLKIQPIRTTPYHPQTDGLIELFNQTLKDMLRRVVSTDGKDWDKLIPYLLFAYREVPQASTGFAPFELLYGRQIQ